MDKNMHTLDLHLIFLFSSLESVLTKWDFRIFIVYPFPITARETGHVLIWEWEAHCDKLPSYERRHIKSAHQNFPVEFLDDLPLEFSRLGPDKRQHSDE